MQSGVILFNQGISSAAPFFGHMIAAQVMSHYDAVSPPFTLCLFQSEYTNN